MSLEILGTAYFPSVEYAVKYYVEQLHSEQDVKDKIAAGNIHIGQPPPKTGWVSYLDEEEGRWWRKKLEPKERIHVT